MKKVILTESEISHILTLIEMNEQEGTYYGAWSQYWRRSSRIKTKLEEPENNPTKKI